MFCLWFDNWYLDIICYNLFKKCNSDENIKKKIKKFNNVCLNCDFIIIENFNG